MALSTKSTSEAHLSEALDVFDFRLHEADMAALDAHTTTPRETYSFTCDCSRAGTCYGYGDGPASPFVDPALSEAVLAR